MRQLLRVGVDLLFEASRRRWFLALFVAISVTLVALGLLLQVEVVDGAIAGSRLFGELIFNDIVMVDRVLGPLSMATAYASFYGGSLFLAVACSDFAPELLAPGRIEHLLSLPVARWQLLFGTYLGVVVLAGAGTLYGSAGLTLLLGVKAGAWTARLILGSLVGWVGFCALYAAMLAAAFVIRSAAVSAAAAGATMVLGVLSSTRESILSLMEPGFGQVLFRWAVMPFPRLAALATASAQLSAGQPVELGTVGKLVLGSLLFAAALLSLAAYHFDRRDF